MVTYMIAQSMDDTLARGYAAQHQMFATVGYLDVYKRQLIYSIPFSNLYP